MTLHIAPELALPLEAVTETFAILAVKRAGKSNAAVVMAEEMFDAGVPWVAVDPKGDWWGVRAAGDGEAPGLSVLVFGGLHGDIPLEPTAGRLVADLIAEERITCVLDVSEMSKADQRRFLTDFADRLYRRNTEPLHVFCEEADEYIPQRVLGEAAKLVGAFETLVKRGGFRGIGVTLITQRSASLNKDVLTQAGTLIAMRTPSPQDRKAVLAWIDYHAASRDVIDELPMLEAGEAWVFSPQWLKALTKIRFRRRRTFDSGATPKVGGKPKPPATLADVDLAVIKEQMAETIEKAKADDPKELRKRIKQLERELIERPTAEPERIEVEIPVVPVWAIQATRDALGQYDALIERTTALRDGLASVLERLDGEALAPVARPAVAKRAPVARPAPARETAEPAVFDSTLGKGERKVLAVLAQYPDGRTPNEVAFLAGYSAKASTLGVILSKLRKLDLVEPGQPIRATAAGLDAAGGVQALPTGRELLDHWLYHPRMGEGERKVLLALVDLYPNEPTHDELCELTGYSSTASTIGVILSKLRKLGLVDKGARRIAAEFAESIA